MPRARAWQFAAAVLLALSGALLVAFDVEFWGVAGGKPKPEPQPASFDYYVLVLSWAPAFCREEADERNAALCGAAKPFAFTVRGLWPQRERGFPMNCDPASGRVPQALVRELADIMPLSAFAGHQWRAHGSCSGLAMDEYFALTRRAFERIVIPESFRAPAEARDADADSLRGEFVAANPGLAPAAIRIVCSEELFREVRICLTKELAFRPCGEDVEDRCRTRVSVAPLP